VTGLNEPAYRRIKAGLAIGALTIATATLSFSLGNARSANAASDRSSDSIVVLTNKVRSLSIKVSILQGTVSTFTSTGLPGLYPSMPQMYDRVFALEGKVGNLCRYNQLVASIFQSGTSLTTQTVKCS
jgi:hypothetical protein